MHYRDLEYQLDLEAGASEPEPTLRACIAAVLRLLSRIVRGWRRG